MDLNERILKAKRIIFNKAYEKLNEKQREAVFYTEGPLLVLAGAGSGKTTVLVNRISHIIRYGNAYHSNIVPQEMCFEAFADKLEKIAEMDNPDEVLLNSVMESFAVNTVFPYQILAITFTNKAAGEIKSRLEAKLGDGAYDIWAGTFHSICARILRMHIDALGYNPTFTIYDTDDQKRLMKSIIKDYGINDKTFPVKTVLNEISRAKENLFDCVQYELKISEHDIRRKTIAKLYKEYETRKKNANALDFDDLIMLTVKLFEKNPEILEKYKRKFKYILVDEYQDTNIAQFKLTKILCNENNNIMVVGDDDQSIYKFRGATIENILNFDCVFEDTKTIKLEQNYRSTDIIVNAANNVIANNKGRKGKTLNTQNEKGEKITVKNCENQESEARYIVNKISDMVEKEDYSFDDFAVLYRMNAQGAVLETNFAKSGIPYRIIGGTRFYERKEIKDVIAYLCVIANNGDALRLKRIINTPKRGIGEATVEELERISVSEKKDMLTCAKDALAYPSLSRAAGKLMKFAEMMYELIDGYDKLPLGVLLEKVLQKTGYMRELEETDAIESKDRCENVKELVSNATQYSNEHPEASLENFLEEVALVSDIDNYDKDAKAVVMMTIHSAKGLEFPVVFLPGMEEGVFPGSQTIYEAEEEMEEERRLAYVAITRAMKRLFMIHCKSRLVFGKTETHPRSRFVDEIPEDMCEYEVNDADIEYSEYIKGFNGAKKNFYQKNKESTYSQFTSDSEKYTSSAFMRAKAIANKKASEETPAEIFKVGQRVHHPVFKNGMVISAKPVSGDMLYEISFDNSDTKKIMGKYAKMTKL